MTSQTVTPWLSIVTATLNSGDFLARAIKSVAQQSVPGVEHIVVDGGSGDNTLALLSQTGPQVRWVSEPDRGQSDAINKGVVRARGRWVGWLNADEIYLPGTLELVRSCLTGVNPPDVLFGDYIRVTAQGQTRRLCTQHKYSRWLLRTYGCYIPTCAAFFRRDLLLGAPLRTDLRAVMDWDLFLRLGESGAKFRYTPSPLAAFAEHAGQVSNRAGGLYGQEARMLRSIHGLGTTSGAILGGRVLGGTIRTMLRLGNGGLVREARVLASRGAALNREAGPSTGR